MLLPSDSNYCTGKILCNDTFIIVLSLACNCNEAGTIDNGVCDSNGICNCKPNVVSSKCSNCADGYWNLSLSNSDGCQGNYIAIVLKVLCISCRMYWM